MQTVPDPASAPRADTPGGDRPKRRRRSRGGEGGSGSGQRRSSRRRSGGSGRRATGPFNVGLGLFALIALLALVLLGPLMTYEEGVFGGSAQLLRQLGYTAILAMVAFCLKVWKDPKRLLDLPWPLLAAVGWCWFSVCWAIEPATSVRRVLLMTMVLWSTFVLVGRLGYRMSLAVLRSALVLLLGINFLAVYLDPAMGIHGMVGGEDDLMGDWRGIMSHKNMAGLVSAMTVLVFAFDTRSIPRPLQVAVLVPAAAFLWFSGSKTSLGVCVAALALGALFMRYDHRHRAAAHKILGGLCIAALLSQLLLSEQILQLLTDPAAFTGRTVIWASMWSFYVQNPLLGAGYGSFWNIEGVSPMSRYAPEWTLAVAEGHNGYFDLLVTIGPVGLALVIFAMIVVPILRLLDWPGSNPHTNALLMSAMVFMIGHNFTESSLFDRDAIGQVFMVFTIAMIWSATAVRHVGRTSKSGSTDLFGWANRHDAEVG